MTLDRDGTEIESGKFKNTAVSTAARCCCVCRDWRRRPVSPFVLVDDPEPCLDYRRAFTSTIVLHCTVGRTVCSTVFALLGMVLLTGSDDLNPMQSCVLSCTWWMQLAMVSRASLGVKGLPGTLVSEPLSIASHHNGADRIMRRTDESCQPTRMVGMVSDQAWGIHASIWHAVGDVGDLTQSVERSMERSWIDAPPTDDE